MRPDLSDVLSGVQRLLGGEVSAAVSDPFVQEQLAYVALLLEHVKSSWPSEHLAVAAEHDDLRATLAAIVDPLGSVAGSAAAEVARAVHAALATASPSVAETPLDQVLAVDREWRQLVENAVAAIDDVLRAGASESSGAAGAAQGVRSAIDAYLARNAARTEAVLLRLGFGW